MDPSSESTVKQVFNSVRSSQGGTGDGFTPISAAGSKSGQAAAKTKEPDYPVPMHEAPEPG